MKKTLSTLNFSGCLCLESIQKNIDKINQWLLYYEEQCSPLYTSVDIRDAGFKMAVVDTNLFPAGFNNLCEHGLADAVDLMKNAIFNRSPNAKNILIVAEDHTRNMFYLEHLRVLENIVANAGFHVQVAAFFAKETEFCGQSAQALELATASGGTVKVHCFKNILEKVKKKESTLDLVIMNNDLTAGIPDVLHELNVPIFPSIHAGWHARHKSDHFRHANKLIKEFSELLGLDPWQFSCLYECVDHVDPQNEADQQRLYQAGVKLFKDIQAKYHQYGLTDKPFIFIKSDSGTHGLGVIPIEDPEKILELNRKKRAELVRGKGGAAVDRFILQEGVPTIHQMGESPCEVCMYQIDNNLVGGFYRYHTGKSGRENLNSPGGMSFQKICPHLDKYGQDCGVAHDVNIFSVYRILARLAGIAASFEIRELEGKL